MQGLKNAKEIWDLLKTAHEGDELTKITKRETIEGELGRFRLRQGEEPQDMYNRLKTLVNQVRNLGSKKWDDHEVVKVILRSLIFLNPTQVQLIRGSTFQYSSGLKASISFSRSSMMRTATLWTRPADTLLPFSVS